MFPSPWPCCPLWHRRRPAEFRSGHLTRPAGLNARESDGLNELLYSIREKEGIAILLIEHDMSVVMRISDHVVVLDYGKEIADGTAEEVRNDPRVIAAYLGVPEREVGKVGSEVGL